MKEEKYICYLCGSTDHLVIEEINEKPEGETEYGINEADYYRVITQCRRCSVYTNQHQLLDQHLYTSDYNASISLGSIRDRYDKVMSLPAENSDNRQRVNRILAHLQGEGFDLAKVKLLDVGSGTSVFLGVMKEKVPNCACIDPDPAAIAHANQYVGINQTHCGTLDDFVTSELFDVITFNKVLEHVKNPVAELSKAASLLKENGIIYVELPEGKRSIDQNIASIRQEFFVEHYTIFNTNSFTELARQAGFNCSLSEIITEPSGKFTIYGFLRNSY